MTENITVTIETPTDREVVVTRVFDAPRQLVFDALTRPDLIKRWYRRIEMSRRPPDLPTIVLGTQIGQLG